MRSSIGFWKFWQWPVFVTREPETKDDRPISDLEDYSVVLRFHMGLFQGLWGHLCRLACLRTARSPSVAAVHR